MIYSIGERDLVIITIHHPFKKIIMPEKQRSVFIQNEFEDLSFKEISEKTLF